MDTFIGCARKVRAVFGPSLLAGWCALGCGSQSPGDLADGDAGDGDGSSLDASRSGGGSGSGWSGGGATASGGSGGRPSTPASGGRSWVSADGAPEPPGSGGDGSAPKAPDGGAATVPDATAPCATKKTFFGDADGDGFGDESVAFVGCEKPATGKWTEVGGDCNDDIADAHPGQTAFFGVPHQRPGGEPSFDYDCSGQEDPDPSQPLAPTSCGLLALALCGGEGYVSTPRTGAGTNAYCGSQMKTTCHAALAILVCEAVTARTEVPFPCR